MIDDPRRKLWALGFYFESEDERSYTVSLCPNGIGRTWDRTDMGFLLGLTWPSVGFLLGTIRIHSSLRADSVVWLSHTSSVWPWSDAPKVPLYGTKVPLYGTYLDGLWQCSKQINYLNNIKGLILLLGNFNYSIYIPNCLKNGNNKSCNLFN